jgi:hypothetical protein
MMRTTILLASSALFLFGCTGDDTASGGGDASTHTDGSVTSDSSGGGDSMSTSDSAADSGADSAANDTGTTDATDAPSGPVLTIKDYLSWCNVTVNGGTPGAAAVQNLPFDAGTQVTLHADTADNTMFVWGYWTGTSPTDAGGHDPNMDQMVTVNGNMTVQACCPLIGAPNTPCPPP